MNNREDNIHDSITSKQGRVYQLVDKTWMRTVFALVVGIAASMVLLALLTWANSNAFSKSEAERRVLADKRAKVLEASWRQIQDLRAKEGLPALPMPDIYATEEEIKYRETK